MSLLKVDGLSKSYGGVHAVTEISLEVGQTGAFGIIGPNGAGKTTLVNLISGNEKADNGTVLLDGVELTGKLPHSVATLGVARTFQTLRLYRELTVLDNVRAGRHRLKEKPAKSLAAAREILESLDLGALAGREAGTLSYGDQRRVEIARALASEPRLLILDEPAAGMNPTERHHLTALLRELSKRLAMILIEHDVALVSDVCEQILAIDFGRKLASGTPAEVTAHPDVQAAYLGDAGKNVVVAEGRARGEALLAVEGLKVSYGPVQAVQDVSFEVRSGEITVLVGANGAGKSTILRALSGVLPHDGEVHFDGKALPRNSRAIARSGLIQVPEGREILARQTVMENLQLGAALHRAPAGDIDEVLDRFPRLRERLSLAAGSLSGGEQQMLAIARALLAKPRLLALDEPSLGLAPELVHQVFELIASINADGTAVLLVEQNATQALALADRAWVVESGRTTISGTGDELLSNEAVREAYLGL